MTVDTAEPVIPTRRRARYWLFGLLLLAGAGGLLWGSRGLAHLALWRGREAARNHDWRTAESWLAEAQSWHPLGGESTFAWARLNRRLGRIDVMSSALQDAADAGFSPRKLQREVWLAEAQSGRMQSLDAKLGNLLVAGEDLPAICEAYVLGCLLNYRLNDALRLLDLWQADFPDDPQPHYLRGRLIEHSTDFEGAANEYRRAVELASGHGAATYNLGRALLALQNTKEALRAYEQATPILYAPQPGLVGQAHCLRLLGRLDEARSRLDEALASPADDPEVAWRLAGEPVDAAASRVPAEYGHVELAAENYPEAEKWLRQALEADPHGWRNRYSLATALRQQGKTEEAAAHSERVEATKQALAECDRLIVKLRKVPDDVEARFTLGRTFLQHVSEKQGVVWLRSVLDHDPQHQPTHRLLADFYRDHADENPEFAALADYHRRQLQADQEPQDVTEDE
ncbi:tetratricopeptide repeat protein [Maioricimonas rarisocia]|uniref:Tetratricopeptide repeat protein n=1 Tax=Maioricimonas rarisocia TaxID=2528026 RepID=A0A517Z667_9PLAN|nr:tetratricopeptide repeat protein [Maioricimonas rarisocia]QDU37973.1 tetratricopeptide repeat protein [Maioricimonas rarisocia]